MRPQRPVERRQPIESDHPDDDSEGQSVDEEREHDEPGGQDGDEALDLRVDGRVLLNGEGEGQRHRAAQTAPQNDGLVAMIDLLAQSEPGQDRQQPEQHERARHQRRPDERGEERGIAPAGVDEQPRYDERRQQEEEAARPEGELFPHVVQKPPVGRRDSRFAGCAAHQAGRDRRDHAGHADPLLAADEDEIGQGHGEGDLGKSQLAQPDEEPQGDPGREKARDRPRRRTSTETTGRCGQPILLRCPAESRAGRRTR